MKNLNSIISSHNALQLKTKMIITASAIAVTKKAAHYKENASLVT